MLLEHDRDGAELPVVALHEEQQGGEEEPAQAKPAMCHFLRAERSTNAPTTGSTNALAMVAKLVR